jgi:hypothetical protein
MARGPVVEGDIAMRPEVAAGNVAELFSQKLNPSVVGKHERAERDLSSVPAPIRYRVEAPCAVMISGVKAKLIPPKIISSAEFDIPRLIEQGARLVKLED